MIINHHSNYPNTFISFSALSLCSNWNLRTCFSTYFFTSAAVKEMFSGFPNVFISLFPFTSTPVNILFFVADKLTNIQFTFVSLSFWIVISTFSIKSPPSFLYFNAFSEYRISHSSLYSYFPELFEGADERNPEIIFLISPLYHYSLRTINVQGNAIESIELIHKMAFINLKKLDLGPLTLI